MKIKNNLLIEVTNEDLNPDGSFTFPDDVTMIGLSAFRFCDALKRIQIPERITSIDESAFAWCSSLEVVCMPDSVTEIPYFTFEGCVSLKKIYLPSKIKKIYGGFNGCKSLNEVTIPNEHCELSKWSFFDCDNLKRIIVQKDDMEKNAYPVCCIDGFCMHVLHEMKIGDYTILKCNYFSETEDVYVAKKDDITCFGETFQEAVDALGVKLKKETNFMQNCLRIAKQGYMNANDYLLLTEADPEEIEKVLSKNNVTMEDNMPIEDFLELTKYQDGNFIFERIAQQILELMD